MIYLVLNYVDYPERPARLFCGNTENKERKNIAETQFLVRCESVDCPCLDWVSEADKANSMTEAEIMIELATSEWQEEEGA